MLEIIDRITISCSSKQLYLKLLYYFQNSDHYKEWHKDHISCRWIKGSDFSIGSILEAYELLHNSLHRLTFKILNSNESDGIEYKVLFPYSMLRCYGYFKFQKEGDRTVFIAGLKFNIRPILKTLLLKHIESISTHIKEEGESIKKSIENN